MRLISSMDSFYLNFIHIFLWNCLTKYVTSTDGTYIGCFKDEFYNPLLEASFINEPSMTISNCISICEVERHTFAGLRYGTKCFCDSVITRDLTLVHLADTQCSRPCGGNDTQYCGAWLKLSLYQLDIIPETTSPSEQISSTKMIALPSTLTTFQSTTLKTTSTGSSTETSTSTSTGTTALTSIITTVTTSMDKETSASTNTKTTFLPTTDVTTHLPKGTTTNLVLATNSANPTIKMNNNTCSCLCVNVNSPEFKEKVENLIKELEINKKLTSLYINSKICMKDERTSSKTIGTVGVLCLCVPLVMIVVFDISNCFGKER